MRSLSEADALAVALQWATRLTAHAGDSLQLRTIRNALLPVLDVAVTTHWDDHESFDVDKQAFAALRETLGVWRALSCCRGFGGYENPRFWDQVVRRFVKNYGGIEELGRLDFHDEEATPSRVTLKITVQGKVSIDDSDKQRMCDWMRSVCREFFQLGGFGNANESLSAEYHSVLQHLEPFIDERRLAREAIEVQLAFETWKEELQEYADPDIMEAYTVLINEIASSYAKECSTIALAVAPVFRIQGIGFDTLGISTKAEFEAFTCLLARNPFPISHMCPSIHSDIDTTTTFSEFVTTALQMKELSETRSKTGQLASPGKVQALTFLQKSADLHPLVCFFSALPYTRSLECLRFRSTRVDWELTKYEASWLAYACFHPRSKTSSWNDLWMDLSGVADDGRAVLKDVVKHPARAVSVTRLAVVSGVVNISDVRSNDRLQIATINMFAPIYIQANTQFDVLMTLREDTELEMCDLHRQDWCCVLVPGYGFGWVQQYDVAGTREWILEEPVSSSLKVFEMSNAFGVQDGLLVLSAIGGAIETLTLSKKCASGGVLDELILRCPNLKSLSLEPQEQQIFPASRMESSVSDLLTTLTTRADSEAVKCMKMLHVTDMTPHAFASTKVAALEAILQANPSLEQLLLTADDRSSSWDMRTHGAELEKHNGEILHRSQLLKQRWAFLSVTNRHRPSALGQLDSAVIAMVFEFATQPVRRLVHLSPLVIDVEWLADKELTIRWTQTTATTAQDRAVHRLMNISDDKCGPGHMVALEIMLDANQSLEHLLLIADDFGMAWLIFEFGTRPVRRLDHLSPMVTGFSPDNDGSE